MSARALPTISANSTIAAAGFAAAAQDNPGNTPLALRAFRQALVAGDTALAVKAARGLDASGSLPPDGTLLLLVGCGDGARLEARGDAGRSDRAREAVRLPDPGAARLDRLRRA